MSGKAWVGGEAVTQNLFIKLGEDWDGLAVWSTPSRAAVKNSSQASTPSISTSRLESLVKSSVWAAMACSIGPFNWASVAPGASCT